LEERSDSPIKGEGAKEKHWQEVYYSTSGRKEIPSPRLTQGRRAEGKRRTRDICGCWDSGEPGKEVQPQKCTITRGGNWFVSRVKASGVPPKEVNVTEGGEGTPPEPKSTGKKGFAGEIRRAECLELSTSIRGRKKEKRGRERGRGSGKRERKEPRVERKTGGRAIKIGGGERRSFSESRARTMGHDTPTQIKNR